MFGSLLRSRRCMMLLRRRRISTAKNSGIVLRLSRKQRKVKIKSKGTVFQKIKEEEEEEEEEENVTPLVMKYWYQRYDLFSRYDLGIKLDEEGWFSVTPEVIAARQASRCAGAGVVIDAFAGVGGNAIQFAKLYHEEILEMDRWSANLSQNIPQALLYVIRLFGCHHVVAIDIDPKKVALAFHNAKIYGVEDYIDFVVGDFFQLAPYLKGDVVFLSPPWGGPSYKSRETFTLDLLKPKDGHSLFQVAQEITPNIIMFLPRTIDVLQTTELSWLSSPPLDIEVEENFVRGRPKGITVYFGNMSFT